MKCIIKLFDNVPAGLRRQNNENIPPYATLLLQFVANVNRPPAVEFLLIHMAIDAEITHNISA